MSQIIASRCYLPAVIAVAHITGCSVVPDQSMLHPAGPAAAEVARLWWIMFGTFSAVFALVLALLAYAVFCRAPIGTSTDTDNNHHAMVQSPNRNRMIIGGGVVMPLVVLTPLFLLSLKTSKSLITPADAFTIRVVGHMWWWEVRYPDHNIVTANEIHIPVGRPVRLELTSADVIHSFWVPRLNGKRDMIPGVETVFWIEADKAGSYRGQCAEYCGTQHATMAFQLVALPEEEFGEWLQERSRSRPGLSTGSVRQGFNVFMAAGCAQCHAIGNTPAIGNVGPDLTHLGSRRTLGAAMLPNTDGNLAGWIADPQAIKPGIKMPRSYLSADELQQVVEFLRELK